VSAVAALSLATVLLAAPQHRAAVVVGANRAMPGRQPLRYSHQDARSSKS
jgi:hypothetical protein